MRAGSDGGSRVNRPCAWCLAERGQAPHPGDSHGICRRHKNEVLGVPQVRVWYWADTGWSVPLSNPRFAFAGTVLLWACCAFAATLAGLFVGQLAALTVDWIERGGL